jgi:glycosyltransferase involved in cell wall biosynthesis
MSNNHPPDLSLIVPCYNEEECLGDTMPPLAEAFRKAGIDLELVLVDNGSADGTSTIIDRLIERGLPARKASVKVNRGWGLGVKTGLRECSGRYIGTLCADGQVAPESVLLIYRALAAAGSHTMAKARRRFRPDGMVRKIVSIAYNFSMLILFPGLRSLDVNGYPKVFPADILRMMELTSDDWFLDAEAMLKAQFLKLMVIEIDVPGHLRKGGRSSVRLRTIVEFIRNIARYRLGGPWRQWRRQASSFAAHEAAAQS